MALRNEIFRSVDKPVTEANADDAICGQKKVALAAGAVNRVIRIISVAWLIVTAFLWWMR